MPPIYTSPLTKAGCCYIKASISTVTVWLLLSTQDYYLLWILYFNADVKMRGRRKRAVTAFKAGHQHAYKRSKPGTPDLQGKVKKLVTRAPHQLQDFVLAHTENGLVVSRDTAGVVENVTLPMAPDGKELDTTALRPKESVQTAASRPAPTEEDNRDTYIVLHKGKLCDLWNKSFRDHREFNSDCTGDLLFNDEQCSKWGMVWEMALRCNKCHFQGEKQKIYDEVFDGKPGRKSATINLGLQVGLSKQGVSNTGLREVLASANIVPPCGSSLQKAANKVGKKIVKANNQDLQVIREELKTMNEAIGRAADHPIPVEADATYNNRLSSGVGNTPFQPGTQATMIVAENLTPKKKIIAVKTYSKLCSCRRPEPTSPHRADCTANLPEDSSIGNEGQYLVDSIQSINDAGLQVGDLTLDGDSSSRASAAAIDQPGGAAISTKYCTRHLTRVMERHLSKTSFSPKMFPGRSKSDKDQSKTRFCFDVGDRVNAEFNACYAELGHDLGSMQDRLDDITDAIVDCYRGNCGRCTAYSYVCSEDNHWFRSYIDVNPSLKVRRAFIQPSNEDIAKLRQAIAIRLGSAATEKTSTNSNQNKCEASNRGIKKAVPSSLTFKRNYDARVQSAVHSMNNGPGTSITKLCEAVGAPVNPNSAVGTVLRKMDSEVSYQQARKQSARYKESRRRARQHRYRIYDAKKNQDAGYRKDGARDDVLPPLDIPLPGPSSLAPTDCHSRR